MIYNDLEITRGPNSWSAKHNNLAIFRFNLAPLAGLVENRKEMIIGYFHDMLKMPPASDNIFHILYIHTVSLAAHLQGKDLYRDIVFPSEGTCIGIVEYRTQESGKEAIDLACSIVEAVIMDELPIPLQLAAEKIQHTINNSGDLQRNR